MLELRGGSHRPRQDLLGEDCVTLVTPAEDRLWAASQLPMSAQRLPVRVEQVGSLTCIQLNAARSSIVNDELLFYVQSVRADIILIQEPFVRRGLLSGFDTSPYRVVLSKGHIRPGSASLIFGVAIVVLNPSVVFLSRGDLSDDNTAAIKLTDSTGDPVTLISTYFRYREPTADLAEALARKLGLISGVYLVCADANAFSTTWFSRFTDHRGRVIDSLIASAKLRCLNVRSPFKTFSGPRGRTNIDITLCSESFGYAVNGWSVIPGGSQ